MDPIILRIEPELDERAATSTMARAQRVYEQGARDISRVMRDQMNQGTTAAGQGFDELETKARKAYLGMQDASEKVASAERKHQAAMEKGAANAESLGRKVERARLAEIEAIERATAAYKEYGHAADQAGRSAVGGLRGAMAGMRSAGGEAASGFMEGFAGSSALMRLGSAAGPVGLALAGVAAIGAVSGKVLVDNISAGMEQLRMRDLIQTRLGVDKATMETIGTAAGTAFARGFGGSTEENLKTISAGIRAGLIGPKSSDAELSKFTERMDTTSKITGQDPTEIAAKTRNIVRNGLATDYTQVLDILNSEAGKQLDITGDLLDTLEEYATDWHKVGLSAVDATGLMKQMYDAGIRNTDVAADSIRELITNASDGSKLTAQAFTSLGFNADEMNRKFAAGGASAREAFGAVLTALHDVQDPQDRNNIGLALFKTKWEENKTAIEKADLKTAAADMGKVAGATEAATPKLNEHADAWTNLGNKISEMWDKTERKMADGWLGKFIDKTLPNFLSGGFDLALQLGTGGAQLLGMDPLGLHDNVPPFAGGGGKFDPPAGPPDASRGWFPGLTRPDAPGLGHGAQSHMPTATDPAASTSLPPAPVLPLQYTNTAGLPSGIANAQQSLDERKHDVAEKEARVAQLEQLNAKEDDLTKARNDLTKAQQDQLKAEQSLTDARINATKQANKQLSGLASGMEELGAQLDKDFGISKGLGGIVENAVRALGNALAAPFLQALGFVAKANPNEGSGIVGMLAANGMFGQQYTPGSIAAAQMMSSGGGGYPGVGPVAGIPSMPGESARDFAHRAMMPYWASQGITATDHAADQAGEHQNGALDIPVSSIAQGNAVMQQLLRDPNVYGAIFNNQTYGYGHGATPQDYKGGHTGDPSQDHQNHVHALYKPGGADNITAGAQGATGALNGLANAASAATNALGGSTSGWDAVAKAESGGNWQNADTGHNGHYGGLQFSPSTWNAFGGQQFAPMPNQASREQQIEVANRTAFSGYNGQSPQGLGAWEAITNGSVPGINVNSPASVFGFPGGGGPMYPGTGMSQGIPGMSPLGPVTPAVGPGVPYASQGGNSGNIVGGLPMDGLMAAAGAADLMMPGAGAAAKIGIQVANRTVGYVAQNMGIAANAVGEFLTVGDNPKGSIGAGWFGKLAGGIAGAAPALPNLAGGKKPPGPMDQAGGGQQGGNVDNSQTNNITVTPPPGTSANTQAAMVAEQSRMREIPGRQ